MSLVMGGKIKGKVILCPKICVVSPFFEISSVRYNKAMKGFPNITFEVIYIYIYNSQNLNWLTFAKLFAHSFPYVAVMAIRSLHS
jgi:hypothetical protein